MTFMENEVGRYAIYRIADGDFSHLWVNGKEIKDFSDSGNTGMNLQLKNTRILQYCYTKITQIVKNLSTQTDKNIVI